MANEPVARRRRGAALEEAILQAAWAVIVEQGYGRFTVDAVAERAGTSKAVLYRRWASKPKLAQAAVEHVLASDPVEVGDTGTLRGDVIELLRQVNDRRVGLATHFVVSLGDFYRETGTDLAFLRESAGLGRPAVMDLLIERAVDRGEIARGSVSGRVARLPIDLLRLELLMRAAPVSESDLVEIVDEVFMPLVER